MTYEELSKHNELIIPSLARAMRVNMLDDAGSVSESVQLHPGIRPKCQAAKLLDPDPIVRSMAEEAILVMGTAAKDYLNEQRAKASPELQQAIDKIWRRIVAEGR